MKIYIASSWKNVHAVQLLTHHLRENHHEVLSFVEFEQHHDFRVMPFDRWIETDSASKCFNYDTLSAMTSDLVIYIGPSGKDAIAEVAMAWVMKIPIIGMWAKGEDLGLMRKMMTVWVDDFVQCMNQVTQLSMYKSKMEAQTSMQ